MITSHTPFVGIAILAGLEVSGWSDGRLEFEDGCSMRTAVPRIWRAERNDLLPGRVSCDSNNIHGAMCMTEQGLKPRIR